MHSILIVENQEKWRNQFKQGLKNKGYRVSEAETVEVAKKKLTQNGDFRVVVLNLHLQTRLDYLAEEVLKVVSQYSPMTTCIIVSGNPDELMAKTGRYKDYIFELLIKGGGDDPLDYDLSKLFDAVERAIEVTNSLCHFQEVIDVIDECLHEDELEEIVLSLADEHKHPAFLSGNIAGNTKRVRLSHIWRVLQTYGPQGTCSLCRIVARMKRMQGNQAFFNSFEAVCTRLPYSE
jgi:CheY-like chemotaxis protein